MQAKRLGSLAAFVALLPIAVGFTAAGCGLSEQRQAKAAATTFLDAAGRGDGAVVERSLTNKARANAAALEPFLNRADGGAGHGGGNANAEHSDSVLLYEVGEPEVEDGIARVPVRFKGRDGETPGFVRMRREDGEWRVFSVAAQFLPGQAEIEFNLESPDGLLVEMMRGMGKGLGQTLRAAEQGMAGFAEGFEQGYHATGDARIREVPPPPPHGGP